LRRSSPLPKPPCKMVSAMEDCRVGRRVLGREVAHSQSLHHKIRQQWRIAGWAEGSKIS
jgi:hypothetical protein